MLRFALLCASIPAFAQNPYAAAPAHYHLIFENAWARATRVTYEAHETAPVHEHPPTPVTVYVYVIDGDAMRFHHITGEHVAGYTITRKLVKAGAIRFAHGAPEIHSVEYLGDQPTEYARIELRTEPLDRPIRDVRLPQAALDASKPAARVQFENRQACIVRMMCPAAQQCPSSEHPADPAVLVILSGPRRGDIEWLPAGAAAPPGPLEAVRIELKTKLVTPVPPATHHAL